VFPIRGCRTSYAHVHHDYPATDIWAARGCRFVSPVAGVVDEVRYVDSWSSAANLGSTRGGLFVSVVGVDGVRYYGSHLSAIAAGIRPGAHVSAGTLLGRVGATGDAAPVGPHLHFGISWPTGPGIWWVRRGEVYPWPYLDAWSAGLWSSPVAAVRAKEQRVGRVPACTAEC
jgi:murein DD-endopeptidase MepM/ murein hydrolase activator NlpD